MIYTIGTDNDGYEAHRDGITWLDVPCDQAGLLSEADLQWLVGYLEGEGAFVGFERDKGLRFRIAVQANDKDVMDQAASLMGATVKGPYTPKNPNQQPFWGLFLQAREPCLRLLQQLRPHMGERRTAQIDEMLALAARHGVSVNCEDPPDLDRLDELADLSGFTPVGLRCTCSHWWRCGRGRAADYLFFRGHQVRHLGIVVWDHHHYFGGSSGRMEKLYDDATLDEWAKR